MKGRVYAEDILLSCMEYLCIDDLSESGHHIAACKRVAVILIKNTIKDITNSEIGRLVMAERSIVQYSITNFEKFYKGDNKVYHFIYLNIQSKTRKNPYFTLDEFFRAAVDRFPENENLNFYKAKPLAMYLVKQNVGTPEINHMLGFPKGTQPREFELVEKKDLYLSIIDQTLDEMISVLKQQTK